MEAEVDQNVVDKKCDEIKWKNLLNENENLIAECLSKDVFYTATASVLTVYRFFDMHDAYTVAQKRIAELEAEKSNLTQKIQKDDYDEMIKYFSKLEVEHLNFQLKYQHLKECFVNKKSVTSSDAPAFNIENTTSLLTEIENLMAPIKGKTKCVTMPSEKPKLLAPGMYVIDVEPIPPCNINNREVHLDYLKQLKESVATLREIVEEARVEKPLDRSLASACSYTKHSQELLEYVIGTCPKDVNKRDKKIATAPLNRKKRVTFVEPCETSPNNTQTHVEKQKMNKTKEPMIPSTGVNGATAANGSKPRSNTKKDRTFPAKSDMKKVEDHPRNNKSSVKRKNRVDSSISYKRTRINSNSNSVCKTCNKCLMSFNHDKCVVKFVKFVKNPPIKKVWRVKQVQQVWQATGKLFTNVGYQWQPTGRKLTLGEQCPLTRFAKSKVMLVKQPENVSTSKTVITERFSNTSQKPLTRYQRKNKQEKAISTVTPITVVPQSIDDSVKLTVCSIDHPFAYDGESLHIFGLYTSSLLNAACKKAMNLFKKGLLIRGEAVEAYKRRRSLLDHKIQQLSKGSSEGSGIILEVPDEPKDNSEVAEKQDGNVQTSLTLSSAKLEIQSMVDVPIHQEDPTVQRTPLIDTVISMVTDKTTSTPTPTTTQAQVQMCLTSCWKDNSRISKALLVED
ncbi:hypothetical protein Tco_0001927 [Tanacetum coccineum]